MVKYCIDHIFSQLVIVSFVTVVWRSLWNILNDVLLPDNAVMSNLATLLAGHVLAILSIALQTPVKNISARLDSKCLCWRLIVDLANTLVAIVAVICVWRGYWNLIEKYVLPDPVNGGWFCHVVGYFGLLIVGCSSSLYGYSYLIDGSGKEGKGTQWSLGLIAALWPLNNNTIITTQDKEPNDKDQCTDL